MEQNNNVLKLYSITEASKELSIRKEILHDLIENGKIGIIELGKRKKISHIELVRYIKSNTVVLNPQSKNTSCLTTIIKKHKYSNQESTLNEINEIFKKNRRN